MTTDDLMTIRQMCDEFDVTLRTLRFYEAKELLFPIRQGTKRLFTRRDRARLKLILRGKRYGFNLEDLRQLLDLYDHNRDETAQIARSYELAAQRLKEMETERDALDASIAELKGQMTWAEEAMNSARKAAAE
jgi:DNA-binding transcriptional MerR regulator